MGFGCEHSGFLVFLFQTPNGGQASGPLAKTPQMRDRSASEALTSDFSFKYFN